MGTFFSEIFGIERDHIDSYGAFDISLVNDLPLFIDPFLIFHSDKPEYQELHERIIEYLVFLRDMADQGEKSDALLKYWYCFPEVKQNWLGFSLSGNVGAGLGIDFARTLHTNLNHIFSDFGEEQITEGSHIEKICLISEGVGRDSISDFVTNLIKDFFLNYTQLFCKAHLPDIKTRLVSVNRSRFNYKTQAWETQVFRLPWHNNDYVILTPKDMLTRDESWINRGDFISNIETLPSSIEDHQLRAAVSNYFSLELKSRKKKYKEPSSRERSEASLATLRKFPELVDYYIRQKERTGNEAVAASDDKVWKTELLFSQKLREILQPLLMETDFYTAAGGTYAEAHARIAYLKNVIENKGGWRIFYDKARVAFERESDVQILFRLVWFGTPSDFGAEANDGRGPVDFKISKGRHKTLVEMKLAKNTKLEANLAKQVELYQIASDAEKAIKVIIFFTVDQLMRVRSILKRLKIEHSKDIVLIDACSTNKPSGSKA